MDIRFAGNCHLLRSSLQLLDSLLLRRARN
jgi:hypothetical protein